MTKSEQINDVVGHLHDALSANYKLRCVADKYFLAESLARVEYLIYCKLRFDHNWNADLYYHEWLKEVANELSRAAAYNEIPEMCWKKCNDKSEGVNCETSEKSDVPENILKNRISELITEPLSMVPVLFAIKFMFIATCMSLSDDMGMDTERLHDHIVDKSTDKPILVSDMMFLTDVLEDVTIN